jgi:ATP-binding cassette subfamily F protein uup
MLAGRIEPSSGTIETGQTVKLAYYTQENAEMDESMRVIEYIKEAAELIRTADGETITAGAMLERFMFSPNLQWSPIGKLSGGERRRLYLLRTLMGEPNVLLLDEPTNDLDIQTLSILEDYLEQFAGAVITVSHDRYFLDRTATHLFAFEGNGRIESFIGNYSDYLDNKKNPDEQAEPAKAASSVSQPITLVSPGDRLKKLTFKEQKEWDEIEDRIEVLEAQITRLKKEIETAGSDFERIERLYKEEQQATAQLEEAMQRWALLSELVEEIARNKV